MFTCATPNSLLEAARDFAISHLNATDITSAEDEIANIVRTVANVMMQEVAAKMSGKPTYRGVRITCECGGQAEFPDRSGSRPCRDKEYRERWIKTLHGEVEIERAYYRCRECGHTYLPWDEEQGLDKRVWTPRVKELVATTCAALPYKRIYTRAMLSGYDVAKVRIVIADGADWIWKKAGNHFPRSIRIIDYFHACEHIYALAQVLYGEGNPILLYEVVT